MFKGFAVGALAGVGYLAAAMFIPPTKSSILDKAINVAAAGVVGIVASHFIHR